MQPDLWEHLKTRFLNSDLHRKYEGINLSLLPTKDYQCILCSNLIQEQAKQNELHKETFFYNVIKECLDVLGSFQALIFSFSWKETAGQLYLDNKSTLKDIMGGSDVEKLSLACGHFGEC